MVSRTARRLRSRTVRRRSLSELNSRCVYLYCVLCPVNLFHEFILSCEGTCLLFLWNYRIW